jgi:Spy/CpxP family protein refolding chaperone
MKILKISKVLVLALLMAVSTFQLWAQGPGPDGPGGPGGPGRGFQMTEEDVKQRVDNLAETLDLTEKQHKILLDYELESYTKMQVEFEKFRNQSGPPPDREEMRARMMKLREERDAKYREVLTKDQMAKFEEIQEQRREQMRQQYQQNNPEGEGEQERPARGRGRN